MALRPSNRAFVLVIVSSAIVLIILGLGQEWLSGDGTSDSPGVGDEIIVGHKDNRDGPVVVDRDGHDLPASSRRTPDRQGAERIEAPIQPETDEDGPSENLALRQAARSEQQTDDAALAAQSLEEPKLVVGTAKITGTSEGPVATIPLDLSGTQSIGQVVLVAFIPQKSDARILDLSPAERMPWSGVQKRISDDGRFAAFQGIPEGTDRLLFRLSVSEPVVVTIKGNCGIDPFEIELRPAN